MNDQITGLRFELRAIRPPVLTRWQRLKVWLRSWTALKIYFYLVLGLCVLAYYSPDLYRLWNDPARDGTHLFRDLNREDACHRLLLHAGKCCKVAYESWYKIWKFQVGNIGLISFN